MEADGEAPDHPSEDEMYPDERQVIAARIEALDDEKATLTLDEVVADLDVEIE